MKPGDKQRVLAELSAVMLECRSRLERYERWSEYRLQTINRGQVAYFTFPNAAST